MGFVGSALSVCNIDMAGNGYCSKRPTKSLVRLKEILCVYEVSVLKHGQEAKPHMTMVTKQLGVSTGHTVLLHACIRA